MVAETKIHKLPEDQEYHVLPDAEISLVSTRNKLYSLIYFFLYFFSYFNLSFGPHKKYNHFFQIQYEFPSCNLEKLGRN